MLIGGNSLARKELEEAFQNDSDDDDDDGGGVCRTDLNNSGTASPTAAPNVPSEANVSIASFKGD